MYHAKYDAFLYLVYLFTWKNTITDRRKNRSRDGKIQKQKKKTEKNRSALRSHGLCDITSFSPIELYKSFKREFRCGITHQAWLPEQIKKNISCKSFSSRANSWVKYCSLGDIQVGNFNTSIARTLEEWLECLEQLDHMFSLYSYSIICRWLLIFFSCLFYTLESQGQKFSYPIITTVILNNLSPHARVNTVWKLVCLIFSAERAISILSWLITQLVSGKFMN